ncbi:MAG TPA: class I SAM-dependent methyltransferase [Casimicrobiaceae bacterium]|nr:class I SAM-dependent methyltransferase [Casimicrobiaceae bacterium]
MSNSPKVTERFSDRADAYVRGRPTYPSVVVEHLESIGALQPGSTVVDVGVGTGLSSEPFLARGHVVIGVEPNAPMRVAGEGYLRRYTNYRSVDGTAEATSLPDCCADLVIAGQAFHWFDVARAAAEARRILRTPGWAALMWNDRHATGSPFLSGYEALLHKHGNDYAKIAHRHIDTDAITRFFAPAIPTTTLFEHARSLTRADLIALVRSASYLPKAGTPQHDALIEDLDRLFEAEQRGGLIQIVYSTRVHHARLH